MHPPELRAYVGCDRRPKVVDTERSAAQNPEKDAYEEDQQDHGFLQC